MRRAGERSAIVVVVLLASAGACRQYGDEDAPAPASSSSYVDAASDPGTVDASGAGDDVQPELDAGPTTPSGDGGAREAGSDAAAPRDLYVFVTRTTGLVGATNIAWSQSGLGACSELRHLYCFEVP